MGDNYNITKAIGGKDDVAIERGLLNKIDELKGGSEIEIKIDRCSPRKGKDRVDIHTDSVYFFDKKDFTQSPVAIQAAVRILHKHGFRGYYCIEVSGNVVAIQSFWTEKERKISTKEPSKHKEISSENIDDTSFWNFALANPFPLFLALENDSMVALFDKNGFFLSPEATKVYEKIKSKPQVYSARSESGNNIYIGISNQSGGRWKRSHAYHLGGLAHEILGTTRYYDQNHSHWVESWFKIESFKKKYIDSKYHIRMREKVIISFFAPEPHATKEELKILESRLISIAIGKGLNVLNIIGDRKDKKLINEISKERKSLFIIPCCSAKLSGGNKRSWDEERLNQESNKFKLLDNYRIQMINFYSGLPQENALNYYKNRGSGEGRIQKALKAWQKNLKIHEGRTMMAIDRYNGNLYKALNTSLRRQLRGCELDNVLIVSALMGIIAPTDLIPDYELMMMDRSPDNKKVWKFWKDTFEDKEVKQSLQNVFSGYDYIYCLMSTSTGYIKSVSELLFDHNAYKIISQEIGQTNILKSWGRVLSEALLKRISSLDGVKRVAEIHNCVLMELNASDETKGHCIFSNRKYHYACEKLMPILSPRKSGGVKMSQADEIRDFVQKYYIEPARREGQSQITIRAGDVDRKMRLGRVPNVNQVLGGKILQNMCRVRLKNVRGPYQSSTTTYTFEIVPKGETVEILEYPSKSEIPELKFTKEKRDIPTIIRELSKLKDDGIITEEEFEKKKKDLLNRL